jgi:hypothetical protein
VVVFAWLPCPTAPAATQQQDDYEFGMLTVKNETDNVVINYQFRWGDGQWVGYQLKPGEKRNHYHKLDGNRQHPVPYIRFNELYSAR